MCLVILIKTTCTYTEYWTLNTEHTIHFVNTYSTEKHIQIRRQIKIINRIVKTVPLKRVVIYVESIRNTIWIQWMIWCVAISFHDFFDSFFFFSILLLLLLYFVLNELVEISNRSRKLFNYFLLPHRIRRISLFKIRYRKSRIQFTALFFLFFFYSMEKISFVNEVLEVNQNDSRFRLGSFWNFVSFWVFKR